MFTGHVHNYQRTNPLRGLTNGSGNVVASPAEATTYIVAAGVGAPVHAVSTGCGPQFTNASYEYENYVIVDFNGNSIDMKAYRLDTGAVIDELAYSK